MNLRAANAQGLTRFFFLIYAFGSVPLSCTVASRQAEQEAQEPQQVFLLEASDFAHRDADAHPIHEIPFFLGRRIYHTASTTIKRSIPLMIQSAPFMIMILPFRNFIFNTVYRTVTKA